MGKIGIIGAGMAGLSCGELLKQHGENVEIFDRHPFPGGRCSSLRHQGFVVDQGAQAFFGDYPRTREIAKRLGLESSCISISLPPGYLRRGRIYNFLPFLSPAHFHPLQFFSFDILSWQIRYQISKFLIWLFASKGRFRFHSTVKNLPLDRTTIYEFISSHYSTELYSDFIEPCLSPWIQRDPQNLSALFALSYLHNFFSGFWNTMGGMGYLAEKLAKRIRNVKLGKDVSEINPTSESVTLRIGDKEEAFDCLVVATDAEDAARLLFRYPVAEDLKTINYSPALIVVTALDRRPERISNHFGLLSPKKEGHPFSMVINSAAKFVGNVPPRGTALHWMVDGDRSPGTYDQKDNFIQKMIDHEARALFLDYPKPVFTRIIRWPRARVIPEPGNLEILRRLPIQVAPRLYLAGSYFHAYGVEGAILSGRDAAYRILEDRKKGF